MSSLVSLVVVSKTESAYTRRFINSVRKQDYKNIEIVFVEESETCVDICSVKHVDYKENVWISNVLDCVEGDYIIFCSPSSVMPVNYISKILENISYNDYIYTKIYEKSEKEYILFEGNLFSVFGKLFKVEKIREIVSTYDKTITFEELNMIYNAVCSKYEECDVILYETDPNVLKKAPITVGDIYRSKVWLLQLTDLPDEDRKEYIALWLDYDKNEFGEETISKADKIRILTELFIEDKDLLYFFVQGFLKKEYNRAITEKNEKSFNCVKVFFEELKCSDDFIEIMVDGLGINMLQYEFLKKYNLKDYLFLYDKTGNRGDEEINEEITEKK